MDRLSQSIFNAQIDINPHQVEAALFAFKSPLSNGVVLADEVGLGKTIEAGLVMCQYWSERKRKLIIIAPASLRKQWSTELQEKFFMDSIIIDGKTFKEELKRGNRNPFEQQNKVVITSYPFASRKEEYIFLADYDLAVLDEAHKLRNVHKGERAKTSYAINRALRETKKILLTATPLQNSLLELYGLVSIIDPFVFGDRKSFQKQFSSTVLSASDRNDLKERLKPIVHRTLRKDVLEYIKYTKRIPLVEEFTPNDDEIALYNLVSDFLLTEDLYAIPSAQRTLITLVARKLLASSTRAIMGTLETMIKRLEKVIKEERITSQAVYLSEEDEELLDEYLEEEESFDVEIEEHRLTPEEIKKIEDEIEQLRSFVEIAKTIEVDTKVKALVSALGKGFEEQKKLGASNKALIFTESKRTQEFLYEYLSEHDYKGKVVLFNGVNNDVKSKEIYAAWIKKHEDSDRITGSKAADLKQAIVDYFRDEAQIMIATEAGSEGINLQFCNMLINYDLPWNPQRVEQRIGRVHRYGQKHDVVVINFINKKNAADRRIYQLLNEKFKLFSGVFGASDEVLGSIASGVDFEKRILGIYQKCRNEEEIDQAFEQLQDDFSENINEKTLQTRQQLLDNFDEDVHLRLKSNLQHTKENYDRFAEVFWEVSRFELEGTATFNEEEKYFDLSDPIPPNISKGRYHLGTKTDGSSHLHSYRLNSPLGEYVLERSKNRKLSISKLRFDLSNNRYKISILEPLRGKHGYLLASKLTIDSYDTEEHILLTAITDGYKLLDEEMATKLFSLGAMQTEKTTIDTNDIGKLEVEHKKLQEEVLRLNEQHNNVHFTKASEKLHKWADDKLLAVEKELKETKAKIKELNRQSSATTELEEQSKIQSQIKEQEKKRRKIQREIFDIEDEIAEERDELIDRLKGAMQQKIETEQLFIIEWEII
jgi:superfamily II DNA/RNA helicase